MSWQQATISPDGTHHCVDGSPLHDARFDEVLKFHPPGFAAVRRGNEAWHIRPDGSPAYARRFGRTFGFYEGVAAVVSGGDWHHITTDGLDLSADRYAWCGNFQSGRCTVRTHDGAYLHIDAAGRPVYDTRWRYAGDYRDGIAVVQAADGRSTHVDFEGQLVHERWFHDLDVFHKGLARARDEVGWTHVDGSGRARYSRRFSMVEPFYNGHARVETFDGSLEIINEDGATITVLRGSTVDAFHALSADLVGFWKTETLATAVQLGVFDVLPATTTAVATRCKVTLDGARRLLEALAELDAVALHDRYQWISTPRGAHLASSHPLTLRHAAIEYGGALRRAWQGLGQALRGDVSQSANLFREVAADPERRHGHHRMLQSYAAHDYAGLVERLPITPGDTVLDAGGGSGWLASRIHDSFRGSRVLLGDLPGVIEDVRIDGVEVLGLDLFEPWTVTADVVVLARVLHDWPDEAALSILGRAHGSLRDGGRLAVIELLRPDDGFAGAQCDLHLLAATGGRERRKAEWIHLLDRSGFGVVEVVRGAAVPSLIVARPI